ncbi:MAG: tetratricopeptide repeat protein [Bacteroidia bacterium]
MISNIYNPQNQTEEQVKDNFVVRTKEFKELFRAIEKAKMNKPEQHYLIQGQRGMGKTTLLMRLSVEVKNHEKLNKWLIPVLFSEEQYSIRKLYKLWEQIAIHLEDNDEAFTGLFDEMDEQIDEEDYEEICLELLIDRLKKEKKKLLLLMDNFGDLLDKFSKQERQRLRDVLIKTKELRIIGGSSRVLEHAFDHDEAFHEYFQVVQLDGLGKLDVQDLLGKLGNSEEQKKISNIIKQDSGRIEALRRMSGGVPRTVVMLFEIFMDEGKGSSFKDLEALLDRVTPLYKHRMDDLKANQQEIIDVLALNWDAVPVKDITRRTRLESNVVSAQLNHLEKNNLVNKIPTSSKNNLYMVSERFFNIWYIMRHGRKKDHLRVRWLVEFLRTWCNSEEISKRVDLHIKNLNDSFLHDGYVYYYTEAYAQLLPLGSRQDALIRKTKEYLKGLKSHYSDELNKSDLDLFNDGMRFFNNEEYVKAIQLFNKIRDKKVSTAYIGYCYELLEEQSKAIEFYTMSSDLDNSDAMVNLGSIYEEKGNLEKAKEYFEKAVALRNSLAMNRLGLLHYMAWKNYQVAHKYFLEAIEMGRNEAKINLANLYAFGLKDLTKAIENYNDAFRLGYTEAYVNLGKYYYDVGDKGLAIKYWQLAAEKNNSLAMNNLAWLWFLSKKNKEESYRLVDQINNQEINYYGLHTMICVKVWNDDFTNLDENVRQLLDESSIDDFSVKLNDYLILFSLLLAKGQLNLLYRIFQEEELGIYLMPVYYALMHFMQDEYPDEIKKMGPELKETVDEIIEKVKQMAIDYA